MAIRSVNPATEEVLATFEEHTPEQVEEALQRATTAFRDWRKVPMAERSRLMHRAADYLRQHKERLARLTLPAVARGLLDPDEEAWWDEVDHGVGLRLRLQVPFGAQHLLAQVIEEMLARLNDDIAHLEKRLVE
jgi:uncharacterized protein (DUF2164 family)